MTTTPAMHDDRPTTSDPAVGSTALLGQWDCKTPGFDSVEVVEINAVWVRFVHRGVTFRRSRRGFMKHYRPNKD